MKIGDKAKPLTPPVPAGSYIGVCCYVIDIGEQLVTYKDAKKYNNQIMVGFQLYDFVGNPLTVEIDGKPEPRVLGRTFTVSRGARSGLRVFCESLRTKTFSSEEWEEFDTSCLINCAGMLSVMLNETGEYANIDSVMPLPTGVNPPHITTPVYIFDMEPWNQDAFEKLPEWAQNRIKKSTEWQKMHPSKETISAEQQTQLAPTVPSVMPAVFTTMPPSYGAAPTMPSVAPVQPVAAPSIMQQPVYQQPVTAETVVQGVVGGGAIPF